MRNLASNRWLTAQPWLLNTEEMIKNRSAARGICHVHHASRSCHSFDQENTSHPAFATDPPLLGLGRGTAGTGAADGIRMRAAESSILL